MLFTVKHRFFFGLLLIVAMTTEVSAQNRSHRRRGIILGGLAGAALGVAIGDKGNNETAGALIGAAVTGCLLVVRSRCQTPRRRAR